VLVSTAELPGLRGLVAMVDGGFDPLHEGHVAYFREAAELGAPVLCNVSPDRWVAAKHPPLLRAEQRAELIDAIRYVSYTHISDEATVAILDRLGPRYYVKGADWRGRLPEAEVQACATAGTEVVFLDTVLDSSTRIVREYKRRLSAWK